MTIGAYHTMLDRTATNAVHDTAAAKRCASIPRDGTCPILHCMKKRSPQPSPPDARGLNACPDVLRERPVQVVWCDDVKRGELTQPHRAEARRRRYARARAEHGRAQPHRREPAAPDGLLTFAYFALEFAHERVESLYLHEAFTPANHRGDYVRHNHHDIDPRTLGARVCNMPIGTCSSCAANTASATTARVRRRPRSTASLQTMHDDGMCSGIMYSMAVPARGCMRS